MPMSARIVIARLATHSLLGLVWPFFQYLRMADSIKVKTTALARKHVNLSKITQAQNKKMRTNVTMANKYLRIENNVEEVREFE